MESDSLPLAIEYFCLRHLPKDLYFHLDGCAWKEWGSAPLRWAESWTTWPPKSLTLMLAPNTKLLAQIDSGFSIEGAPPKKGDCRQLWAPVYFYEQQYLFHDLWQSKQAPAAAAKSWPEYSPEATRRGKLSRKNDHRPFVTVWHCLWDCLLMGKQLKFWKMEEASEVGYEMLRGWRLTKAGCLC